MLDTQVFIWWMEENKRLPEEIKAIIDDSLNHIFISVATPWEMIIKIKAKRLKAPENFEKFILSDVFEILPIQMTHVLGVGELPLFHKDPFDRILIAQAKAENLTFITSDQKIRQYKIHLIKV